MRADVPPSTLNAPSVPLAGVLAPEGTSVVTLGVLPPAGQGARVSRAIGKPRVSSGKMARFEVQKFGEIGAG